ncbi:MAG: hypothetical protein ACR2OD_04435 [Gaiellaceae bacterium]
MGVPRPAMGELEQPGTTPRGDHERAGVTCVWCESDQVERLGEFGPGLMTEQWYCRSCRSPFELIKERG